MISHRTIWDGIDALARRHGLSVSALARLAGLDATAFNPSKRINKDGRERWPSTESIAKVLDATGESFPCPGKPEEPYRIYLFPCRPSP
jgi:phage repressor protein C with HTH and peptisase S24 domain